MESVTKEQQLVRACEILFGPEPHISLEFLDYLQLSGLKSAYRKRALETHPDRLIGSGHTLRMETAERFHRVRSAYENLACFLNARESQSPSGSRQSEREVHSRTGCRQNPIFRQTTAGPAPFPHNTCRDTGSSYSSTENLYHGALPHRRLLFGHFLYYSGLANWRTITRILIWQKTGRPRLGELGLRLGMLSAEDITCILRNKAPMQLFGQTAHRLGILSEYQLRVLMFHQQRQQKKFGAILLEKQLVSEQELQELLFAFTQHNMCWTGK
jgi:hypothetical protein